MSSKRANSFVRVGILHLAVVTQLILLFDIAAVDATVDYSYCKKYTPDQDAKSESLNGTARPLIYIGETYSKKYYLTPIGYMADFFRGAFYSCGRFGLKIASVKTACEYGIVEKWFLSNYPTDYSAWIGGFRLGDSMQPRPLWVPTGEPLDFSQFGLNADYIGGPYPPGGYSPIVYPWVNCLSVSRNCPLYTSGPTNPCKQSSTYPDLQFMYLDCRVSTVRVLCEEISYSKEGLMNEVDSLDETKQI